MKYLVKLDVLHPKMSHCSFKATVCLPWWSWSLSPYRADLNGLDFVVDRFFTEINPHKQCKYSSGMSINVSL